MERLHDGHMGVVKCCERAKQSVWWPGIGMTTPLPNRPWERVAADICEVDKRNYLVVIDYFSRYIQLAYLPDMTGATVRSHLSAIFARWGCPTIMVTNNRPQFNGHQFQGFAKAYDFQHVTSSPRFPQANGERAVRMAKHILKQKDPSLALLSYRATPIQATGDSPAQLMLGRQIKTPIPTLEEKLLPQWPDIALVKVADARAKAAYKHHYDRCHSGAHCLFLSQETLLLSNSTIRKDGLQLPGFCRNTTSQDPTSFAPTMAFCAGTDAICVY